MEAAHDDCVGQLAPQLTELDPGLLRALAELARGINPLFARPEPYQQAIRYIAGLLGRTQRKNSWQLAASTGQDSPWRMQRLLNRAAWDADGVRDVVRDYVLRRLWRPDGVLAVTDLRVPKKGARSVGVAPQCAGSGRQPENCQVGVLIGYASGQGCALVDRELYLPESWTADPLRCRRAGVPQERLRHRSRAELAIWMIARSLGAGVAVSWVAGGMAYGQDPKLLRFLDAHQLGYVLAVPPTHRMPIGGARLAQVDSLAAKLTPDRWEWHGTKAGDWPAREEWARVQLPAGRADRSGLARSVLVRRDAAGGSRLACYLVRAPQSSPTSALVAVAGAGRAMDGSVRSAVERVGLGSYEVRTWTAWYRHVTLAMVAMASLATGWPRD